MFSAKSKSRLNVLPLLLLRVAFTAALTFVFTGVVGTHAEAATRLPDLIVSAVSAPSTAQSGQSFVLSASIKNQGRASASTVQAAFYLTKSTSSITGATLLGTQNVGSLSAGARLALTTTLSIPSSTSSGTFYVVAVADPSNAIKESNETNNTRASGAIAVKDLTPPTISGVNATQITASNATITWTTDKTSTSQADYGTTAAYGSATAPDSSLVTSHAVTLSGLTAGKAYHFRAQSKDAAGNAALSSDYTFTTATATTTTATAGNTYYVATNGNDGDPGTETLPFLTLSHGVRVLKPGDTLYVKEGLYQEKVSNIPSGSSWSAPVTVAAYPGHSVTIRPGYIGNPALYFEGKSYIIINGLILDGSVIGDSYFTVVDLSLNAHHIRFQNVEVKNGYYQGVYAGGTAHHNEFINMAVHDNGTTDFDHGLYIKGPDNLVERSDVYRNAGWGVHIYNETTANLANNNIVRNNKVHDNARLGRRGTGIILSSGTGNTAYNNLVWGNAGGIQIGYVAPTDSEVYNNTVYANRDYGIRVDADGTNTILKNNILYQNGTAYGAQLSNAGIGTQQSNNLIGNDPKFVDVLAHDFHLQLGSPAIDAGVTLDAVTTDFDGNTRPQGFAIDLGAFESIDY